MADRKHTPGPWMFRPNPGSGQKDWTFHVDVQGTPGRTNWGILIAAVWGHRTEAEANARLIAAAPTMQEALEYVLCWMTNANFAEPWQVASKVMTALTVSGYDENSLDGAAIAMMKGAASIGPRPPEQP